MEFRLKNLPNVDFLKESIVKIKAYITSAMLAFSVQPASACNVYVKHFKMSASVIGNS